jgi:transposase-like protein
MHVIDVLLDSFTRLFRHHRYSPLEKLCSVILFIAGLSLRDVSERFCLTFASRESVRIWAHRSSSLFRPSKRVRRLVAVDETVLKVNSQICYLWAAIDVDTNEILAVYASKGRGIPSAIEFLRKVRKVLDSCEGKPVIRIERWFREVKNRTKRFYNNVNSKKLKSVKELVTAIAAMHNIVRAGGNTNLTVPIVNDIYL